MDKSLAQSAQTSLQALLANLTLDSMKELHARVEAGLAQAKAVLENPNSSQEEVNAQVQAMKTLTEEVNKALAGGLTSPAELGEGSGATQSEASSTPRRGRGRRGQLTPPATPAPAENQEKKETAEEITDYTNGQGSYPLSDKIHHLLQELNTSTEHPEQVQKLKEAYDKFNEALGQSENGLVNQEVFNAALEEYKKTTQLKKDEEGTGRTRNRRSASGLVYGLAIGSPGSEKRYRNRDGSEKDSVALLNSSDLDDAPLKFIATVENGGIREFSLKGFPETDDSGRKWATTIVTYSGDRKRAIIKVTGKTPKSIYGLYNVTPQVTLDSGNVQSKLQQIRYQLPKAEFDLSPTGSGHTAQQDAEGKAKATGNDRPIFQVKIPTPPGGRIKSSNIPAKGQIKVFLVRGGSNQKFGKTETSATGYDIVAWALIGELGTGYIVPPQYKKESIGDQTLRLVTAYVQQNTENIISDDFVSPLSTDSITPTNPIDRDGAKQTLTQKATDKKNGFNGIQHLTEEEKNAAIKKVDDALEKAKTAIDAATNQAGIDAAKQEFETTLNQVNPTAQANGNAKQTLTQKATDKKNGFNGIQHLTEEEKNAAIKKVDDALEKAKTAIDAATNQAGIDAAKQEFETTLNQVNPTAQANGNAKQTLTQKANLTLALIDDNANLTLFEKEAAKNQVRKALQDALKRIDHAKTQAELEQAKQEALSSLDQVLAEALAKANARTLSGQDKDQTSPSDQVENPEDKDGNQTPASPSDSAQSGTNSVTPPAARRNRRTPPRRSRRSVGFVGNSQTGTTPSAVDKSELQTLVEDLERRLKELEGLSPEALEEAQRILREAQAALANDSLTAQELAELLAKVRQTLNSLQTGTSADKSPSASSSNKKAESAKEPTNATDVPLYGVFGAAVLSLLGALLFAVARKKNSQLDKLSRELNQLVVELEASNKDKKVLNKAKKLADEARLFVDSHQKDSQKESELISEITTVLSQLKEEV